MTPEQEAEFLEGCALITAAKFEEGTRVITPILRACCGAFTPATRGALEQAIANSHPPYTVWLLEDEQGMRWINNYLKELQNDSK